MEIYLRIVLGCIVLIYFFLIFYFVKKEMLELKYTLLWICAGIVMGVLIIFPKLLEKLADLVGILTPINALFVATFFCILVILMSLTAIVSKQKNQIKDLTQGIALYEKRIRDLENKVKGKEE